MDFPKTTYKSLQKMEVVLVLLVILNEEKYRLIIENHQHALQIQILMSRKCSRVFSGIVKDQKLVKIFMSERYQV